jgi:cytoskeletal protein CcmA (bactofilin family)
MESASSQGPDDPSFTAGGGSGSPDGHRPTEINALLGRGTHFEGKLIFEGRVRIEGGFKGEIRGDDVLVIGEGAVVSGDVRVATCIVTGGEVDASIRARDAIELHAPSRVTGSLHAPAIFIDRGVMFEGSCKMAPLEEDDLAGVTLGGPRALTPRAVAALPDGAHAVAEAPATPRAGTALPVAGAER